MFRHRRRHGPRQRSSKQSTLLSKRQARFLRSNKRVRTSESPEIEEHDEAELLDGCVDGVDGCLVGAMAGGSGDDVVAER